MENKNTFGETVALIEVADSHDECLLTQMRALKKAGNRILLVCTPTIRERNPHFEREVDGFHIVHFSGGALNRWGEMRRVLRFMKHEGASKAVMNTAQGDLMRNLALIALFSKIEFTGIIHTTRKFQGSFTQRTISWKVKKYLVLSEHLLNSITVPRGLRIDYFYPVHFIGADQPKEAHQELNVTVIGGVENRRKDLAGFVGMLGQVHTGTHFTFLGKSDPSHSDVKAFVDAIQLAGKQDAVTMYEDFVDHNEFVRVLRYTDVILPLIHPETPSADQYFKNQISGAMTVAFGYNIPLALHRGFDFIEEMQPASFYYDLNGFGEALQAQDLVAISAQMSQVYSPEHQEERYLKFLFS